MQLYEENENIQTDNQIDLWDLAETMWKNFRRYWGRLLLLVIIVTRRLRNATSRINTAFFVTYKQITPHRIWYNRVD